MSLRPRLSVSRLPPRLAAGLVAGLVVGLTAPAGAAGAAGATAGEFQECEVGVTRYVENRNLNLAGKILGTFASWRFATGRGVTVAVVDSGVDVSNAHLADAVAPGTSFAGGAADGRSDDSGHGTAVAGIIGARPVDGSAMVGQAKDATLLPVRVFDRSKASDVPPDFAPTAGRVGQGIRWAADHGADVINVSMSSDRSDERGWRRQRKAVRYALRRDAVVVAASGDATGEIEVRQDLYPAAFPGVIGVSAANAGGVVDNFSVRGAKADVVDVAAPGSNILVTFRGNGDCIAGRDGPVTSWAAGYVSGLAAQLRERFPQEDAATIAYRILASAKRPRPDARSDAEGWGLIQPGGALTLAVDPNQPGPPLPGAEALEVVPPESDFQPLTAERDPSVALRRSLTWWALGGTGLAALVLLARPMLRRRPTSTT